MTDFKTDDEENLTDAERKELLTVLAALRSMRREGGWGQVTIIMRGGDVCEMRNEYTILTKHLKKTR